MVCPQLFEFEMNRSGVRLLCTQLQSCLEQDPLDPETVFATFSLLRDQVLQCLWEPYSSKGHLGSEHPAGQADAGGLCERLKECFCTQFDVNSISKAFFFLQGAVVDIFNTWRGQFGDQKTREAIARIQQEHEALVEAALATKLALDEKHRKAAIRKRFSKQSANSSARRFLRTSARHEKPGGTQTGSKERGSPRSAPGRRMCGTRLWRWRKRRQGRPKKFTLRGSS